MASSNINKIVCGNLNLKPWILCKAPTDIVNNYVQRLYKQVPNNFKTDLLKPRVVTSMRQGPSYPTRYLHTPPTRFTIPLVNQSKLKIHTCGYRSPSIQAKNSFIHSKKPSKSPPTFKIYNTRRYSSSASSSNASFHLGHLEDYRKKIYKPANGIQLRSYSGAPGMSTTGLYSTPGIAKYIAPSRLFNEVNDQLKTLEVTNTICNDLMSVDNMLKEKIRVVRPKSVAAGALGRPFFDDVDTAFKGWNHPSISHLEMIRKSVVSPRPQARRSGTDRVPVQYMRIPIGASKSISVAAPRRENSRYQPPLIPTYYGAGPPGGYSNSNNNNNNNNNSTNNTNNNNVNNYHINNNVTSSNNSNSMREPEKLEKPVVQAKPKGRFKSKYEEVMQRNPPTRGFHESEQKFYRVDEEPPTRMDTWDYLHHSRTTASPERTKNEKIPKKMEEKKKNYGQSPNDFVCRSRRTRVNHDRRETREPTPDARNFRDNRDIRDARDARVARISRLPRDAHDSRDARDIRETREPRDARDLMSFQPKSRRNEKRDSTNVFCNKVNLKSPRGQVREALQPPPPPPPPPQVEASIKKPVRRDTYDFVCNSRLPRKDYAYVPLRDIVQLPRRFF